MKYLVIKEANLDDLMTKSTIQSEEDGDLKAGYAAYYDPTLLGGFHAIGHRLWSRKSSEPPSMIAPIVFFGRERVKCGPPHSRQSSLWYWYSLLQF